MKERCILESCNLILTMLIISISHLSLIISFGPWFSVSKSSGNSHQKKDIKEREKKNQTMVVDEKLLVFIPCFL